MDSDSSGSWALLAQLGAALTETPWSYLGDAREVAARAAKWARAGERLCRVDL